MAIEYTEEKRFTVEQVEALFKSVGWESAQWPERLFKALQHSDTVISAWDGGHLVGLVRVLDDTVMPEESKNAPFYQKHGFHLMDDGRAMQIVNRG